MKLNNFTDLPLEQVKVGVDILTYGGNDVFVLMYYYSKLIEVKQLKNKTTNHII